MPHGAVSATGRALVAAAACAALFVSMAHPPWASWPLAAIDQWVFHVLQAARSPGVDLVMVAVSRLGDTWIVAACTSVCVVALLAEDRVFDACVFLVCMAATGYVSTELKAVFERPRPLAPYNLASFPSSHAALAAAFYASVAWLAAKRLQLRAHRRLLALSAILVAFLVGFSRLYLGAHWLGDVIAGYAIGGFAALLLVAATGPAIDAARISRRGRARVPPGRTCA